MRGHNVLVYTDSLNAALAITKGASRAPKCLEIRQQIFWFCLEENIHLTAEWIPREENELADAISKATEGTRGEIMMNPTIFEACKAQWCKFQADLFASDLSNLVPTFFF